MAPEQLIAKVADFYHVMPLELIGDKQHAMFSLPRHVCMYLMYHKMRMSIKEIGGMLGGRDHSSTRYGIDQIELKMKRDKGLAEQVEYLSRKVTPAMVAIEDMIE